MTWQAQLKADPTDWLLASGEPWTRYRTLVDLVGVPDEDPEARSARAEMLAHPQVQGIAAQFASWGESPLKRHNDASHPIYAFSTLADFGVRASDAEMLPKLGEGIQRVLAHQSPEGAFQTVVQIPTRFGGSGQEQWTWVLCDAPTLLYGLLAMGLGEDIRVQRAVDHLVDNVDVKGWRCVASPDLGKFKGPGRRDDPCPVVNVYALKALAQMPIHVESAAARTGTEMLLWHWECQRERKLFLFGIGTDYRRLKYPFVWYNLLHVVEVLSRFPYLFSDVRFGEMLEGIAAQGDEEGRFTAGSMYLAWRGWSFADKKAPSPWLTLLCCRLLKRVHGG